MIIWTEDRIADVKAMLLEGLSASQIAARIGNGCTRNSVVGIVHRKEDLKKIGFARQAPAGLARQEWRKVSKPRGQWGGKRTVKVAPPAPAPDRWKPKRKVIEEAADKPPLMLSIDDLTGRTCKWPIGDPDHDDFGFCGHEKAIDGGPYCRAHMRLAYVAVPPRKRRRAWR